MCVCRVRVSCSGKCGLAAGRGSGGSASCACCCEARGASCAPCYAFVCTGEGVFARARRGTYHGGVSVAFG